MAAWPVLGSEGTQLSPPVPSLASAHTAMCEEPTQLATAKLNHLVLFSVWMHCPAT